MDQFLKMFLYKQYFYLRFQTFLIFWLERDNLFVLLLRLL